MNNRSTVVCLVVTLLLHTVFLCVNCQLPNPNDPELMVTCYSNAVCESDGEILFNGDLVTAFDCCTVFGNSLRTPSIGEAGGNCNRCINVGFKQSSISISGANTSHPITVVSTTLADHTAYDIFFELAVVAMDANRPFDQILNMQKYDVPELFQLTSLEPDRDIVLRIAESENDVALEEDAQYMLQLSILREMSGLAVHFTTRVVNVSVQDPDSVSVNFEREDYTFAENDEQGVVRLIRSGGTAEMFTITIVSDMFFQSTTLTVQPSSVTSEIIPVSFLIIDNNIGLQGNVTAKLTIQSVSNDRVIIGQPNMATVTVTDDEFVFVGFNQSEYSFDETVRTATVTVVLSGNIAKAIQLRVKGGPMTQPSTVQISGTSVNEIIEFLPGESQSAVVSFPVVNDNIALETIESYILVIEAITNDEVIIGLPQEQLYPSTDIRIIDDDTVTIEMIRSSQSINEVDESVEVCAALSNPSAIVILLMFNTTQIDATDPDDYIGGNQLIMNPPNSVTLCAAYVIQIDNVIEEDESFVVVIGDLLPTEVPGLSLGQQINTAIVIMDSNEEVKVADPVCIREIDVMFLLDSSGSIRPENYMTMLNFVTEVASGFQFGDTEAQFGVVTFANNATLDIRLGEFEDSVSFNRALMQIPYKATTTNTAMGLEFVAEEIRERGRQDVPHVIIVLTDGRSDDPQATQVNAAIARNEGSRILTVGIGTQIDINELNGISSDPDESHVFLIEDFSEDSFAKLLAPLVRETCEVDIGFIQPEYDVNEGNGYVDVTFGLLSGELNRNITVDFNFAPGTAIESQDFTGQRQSFIISPVMTSITVRFEIINDVLPEDTEFFTGLISTNDEFVKVTVPMTKVTITDNDEPLRCSRNAEVIFVVDSTVDESSFAITKQLIIDIMSTVDVSQSATRVSIVQFSTSARLAVQLTDVNDHQELSNVIASLTTIDGTRNLAVAIQLSLQEMEDSGRVGVVRLMYIISSGQSDNLEATIIAAQSAKDSDILIFGIGNNAARNDLERLVSPDLLFITDNFNSEILRDSSVDAICTQVPKCHLDLLFVLESSSKFSSSNFQSLLQLIVRIINQFEIGTDATQVGVISYDSTTSTSSSFGFDIGEFSEKAQLIQAILSLQQLGSSGRRTDLALDLARRQLTSFRTAVPNAVIVVTSGLSDQPQLTAQEGNLLLSVMDTEVFVVGGSTASDTTASFLEEIYGIGQNPDSEHVFLVHSFQEQSINSIFQSITEELCDDDSNVKADPIFTIPIDIQGSKHDLELCYEVYGTAEQYFNLVSDECLSVNAHYSNSKVISHSGQRPMHFIDQISVMAVNNIRHCVTIVVEMYQNECLATVNGAVLSFDNADMFESMGVNVSLSSHNRVLVSVPNCGSENVQMIMSCKTMGTNGGFVEFQIQDGLGIQSSAHGLVGQFWNIPVSLAKDVTVLMRGSNKEDVKVLKINHPNSSVRHVPVLSGHAWFGRGRTSCLYAGDTQGGHVYEVESPNDSLIEGSYKDYIVSSIFANDFKFDRFRHNGNCE